ncbi:hypothetical protein TNCV_1761921 [Trichonephila clavipes]|nr:hypothetical protein TNCV_1761921 [Trichonephila clavipes]
MFCSYTKSGHSVHIRFSNGNEFRGHLITLMFKIKVTNMLVRSLQEDRKWSPGCGINSKQVSGTVTRMVSHGRYLASASTDNRYLALST